MKGKYYPCRVSDRYPLITISGWVYPVIEEAFPNAVFPIGCTHKFVCSSRQSHASTNGFIAGIVGRMMSRGGVCLYISTSRTLFPASLKRYGVEPHQIIFIDVKKEEDVLYCHRGSFEMRQDHSRNQ